MENELIDSRMQGRWLLAGEVLWLRSWIEEHPAWSRKRIARELCVVWDWRDAKGRLKDFAARSLLLKLEAQGHLMLPPLRLFQRRERPSVPPLLDWQAPPPLQASLRELGPLVVEVVQPGTPVARRWAFFLAHYHYLGLHLVGENVGYLVRDVLGREVACLLFGAAAWRCAARDEFLGWSPAQCAAGLPGLANNTRFLILPWVRVPHLASQILGQVARRVSGDWQAKYGHGLLWLETFVERARFAGTCYRAANWQCVGQTRGRSRQDRDYTLKVPIKDVYLYPLLRTRR